ncbi:MAG: hypothetical protein MPJ78_06265 [Hyphomicrobiaceae bacterium]|nr:hypothetical protein [Hyphomicrobiaceae bacterium]
MSDIDALRSAVRAIERPRARFAYPLSFGCPQADDVLGKTLVSGRVHELGGTAATLFATLVLARCEGSVLWCAQDGLASALYPPGLAQAGLDPRRVVLARMSRADDLLHAAHEGLRAGWHMVLETMRGVDLGTGRRLQLAAETGGGLGLVVAMDHVADVPLLPSATTRWHAALAGGSLWPAPVDLHLHLTRNRNGLPGRWTMEWDYASRSFSLVPTSGDRQGDTPRRIPA